MVFNSIEFVLYFMVVCAGFFVLPHRARSLWLLGASYYFYMQWNAVYALLIVFSTVIDFVAGARIDAASEPRARKRWLLVSLALNLGVLFTFKYWTFFHTSMAAVCGTLGLPYHVPELQLLLPVGISFYTFQSLSYTIDIWRGTLKPERSFLQFALYIIYFPQLVAGPIERAAHLLPELRRRIDWDWARVGSGLELMLWGLFKKTVVADRLSLYVDAVYNNAAEHNGTSYLLATFAFAVQIYCDFSGYTDIAIGAARVLGIDLMRNFERPYFSATITEFWRRWHISLSTWLRDYLYIPLGGNRNGELQTYRNLMLTMLLGGLWHGASWNFVVWGALHGLYLAVERFFLGKAVLPAPTSIPARLARAGRVLFTFLLVCLSWIFFRAATFDDAWRILTGIFTDPGRPFIDLPVFAHGLFGVALLFAVDGARELRPTLGTDWPLWPFWLRWLLLFALFFAIVLFGVESSTQFIYFQF